MSTHYKREYILSAGKWREAPVVLAHAAAAVVVDAVGAALWRAWSPLVRSHKTRLMPLGETSEVSSAVDRLMPQTST